MPINPIALNETIAYHEEHMQYDLDEIKSCNESIEHHKAEIKRCMDLLNSEVK